MNILNLIVTFCILLISCRKSATDTTNPGVTTVPEIYKRIYGATDMYVEGNFVVIKSNALPDHKSPYYRGTQWESAKYEAYNGSNPNFHINPNKIVTANLTFKIPLNPVATSTPKPTPMAPIGISLNGIPFYNQYAAGGAPLTSEINSMDQYNGHPQHLGQYHYHMEPLWLTTTKGKAALMGFLLDGFPVYGPIENGSNITNANLDAYHGHIGATPEYPNGIYHYHITSNDPYINGNGFYGVPGTVSQ